MKKINEAKYTRKFNLGDYESEEYSLSCALEEGEEGSDALIDLKSEVMKAHGAILINYKEEEEETNGKSKANSSKNDVKNGKDSSKKNAGSDDEGTEDDESSNSEASDDDNDQSEGDETDSKEDDSEEESKSTKGKPAKGAKSEAKESKKSFKKKPQHYNRSIEQHKEIFAGVVRSINPDWKKDDSTKKKVKKVSESVEGEPFLDENGEVVDSFKARVRKLLK